MTTPPRRAARRWWDIPRRTRKWVYDIATAGLLVLGVYGVVSADQGAVWGLLAAAVTGMARTNVADDTTGAS